MFGEDQVFADIAEELLELYDLEEILELNDVTHEELIETLLRLGRISYPETVVQRMEESST